MLKYKQLSNILQKVHVKRSFDVARYILIENHDIKMYNYFSPIQTGGEKIKLKYEENNVIFYGHKQADRYVFSLHHNNDNKKDVCLVIFIVDKIAYIDNISYHDKCIDGLRTKGGGKCITKNSNIFP